MDIISRTGLTNEQIFCKLYSLDPDLRYEELKKILERYGYVAKETSGGSSHITFRKPDRQIVITIPRHNPVKKEYVRLVRDIVEMEEKNS